MRETTTGRRSPVALIIIGAVLILVVTAFLSSLPRPPLIEVIPGPPVTVPAQPRATQTVPIETELPQEELLEPTLVPLPDWLPGLIRAIVILIVLCVVGLIVRRLIQTHVAVKARTAADPSGEAVEVVDFDEEEVAETIEQITAQLRRGIAVEGAVVECWRRLEAAAADSGVKRRPSQTSSEFTVDVLSRTSVDERAIRDLAELYRQAMFSTHNLSDSDRERAIAALETLSGQLRGTADA